MKYRMKNNRHVGIVVLLIMIFINNTVMATSGDYSMSKSLKVKYQTYYQMEKESIENPKKKTKSNQTLTISDFVYNPDIKMPEEHQKYLFDLTQKRGLDFLKTIALLKHESQMDPKIIAGNDFGYMQINLQNHVWLSKKLGTLNKPLDPFINMEWGTFMLSDFYGHWIGKGISNKAIDNAIFTKLDRCVMSSYNKGITGFLNNGEATGYINKIVKEYEKLKEQYLKLIN